MANGFGTISRVWLLWIISELAWRKGDSRVAYFDVAVSLDGETWTNVLENAESSGTTDALESYLFPLSDAQFVRITGHGTSSNAWNVISEVELNLEPADYTALGDVSGNGEISALDAAIALQYTVGNEELTGDALIAADVSGNGSVSALDASLILQYVTEIITCFPATSACDTSAGESDL